MIKIHTKNDILKCKYTCHCFLVDSFCDGDSVSVTNIVFISPNISLCLSADIYADTDIFVISSKQLMCQDWHIHRVASALCGSNSGTRAPIRPSLTER